MSAPAATRSPGLPDDYYAPEFSITVDGKKVDPESRSDVLEIKVVLETEKVLERRHQAQQLRRHEVRPQVVGLGAVQARQHGARPARLRRPPAVDAARADHHAQPRVPLQRAPTLTVRAMRPLVRLKGSKPPESGVVHENKTDWEIAQKIAQRHKLRIKVDGTGRSTRSSSRATTTCRS